MVMLGKSTDLTTNAWFRLVVLDTMILDQKVPKCETVPHISIISTPKLLKCETVPIKSINSYSERSRAPCVVLLGKSDVFGSTNAKV